MTWNRVRRSTRAGRLLLAALACVAGLARAAETERHPALGATRDEAVVHVVVRESFDPAAATALEATLDGLGSPGGLASTLVLECAVLESDLASIDRLAQAVAGARARGFAVVGITAAPAATPWTALALLAVGGDVLVAPFQSFRGRSQAMGQPSRRDLEQLFERSGDTDPTLSEARAQTQVALLAALFDPDLELTRGPEGVEFGNAPGEGRSLLTRSGEPLVLSLADARSLLGLRWLASRDDFAREVLAHPAGTLLRWLSPEEAKMAAAGRGRQSGSDEAAAALARERSAPIVRVLVDDVIDEATVSLVRRSFARARDEGSNLVVIELDTPGGMVVSMNAILDHIDDWRETGRRVVAYVNDEAISAGMVIALGSDEVFMRPGSSIGAATPVVMGPGGISAPTDEGRTDSGEKIMSYFRTSVRTLAQKTRPGNRNAQLLAEAMVDRQIALVAYRANDGDGRVVIYPQDEYDELVANDRILPGQGEVVARWDDKTLITLTTQEAVDYGFVTAQVADFQDLERRVGLIPGVSRVIVMETNWSENLVRLLGAYSFLIFLAACVLAYVEFKIPGFGLPGIGSILCFSILLLREYLGGMAEIPEILLFFAGAGLIAVEIFLLPGTIFFGVAGALCALVGLYLSFHDFTVPNNPFQEELVQRNLTGFVSGVGGMVLFGLVFARYFRSIPWLGRLVSLPSGTTSGSAPADVDFGAVQRLVGREAVVVSDLRPGGRIRVGEEFVDAVSEGKYVERGSRVRVQEAQGNRVVVVPLDPPSPPSRAPRV